MATLGAQVAVAAMLVLASIRASQAAERCEPAVARVVSIQGLVEVQPAGTADWVVAALDDRLCFGDTIRVGELARAALALANDSVLRFDQRTTLRLAGEVETGRSLLDLLFGYVYFFSHRPRALEVDTPIANAAAEGTEFLVRARPDRTEVVMLDGRVRLTTAEGEVLLASGDAGVAVAGEPPRREIVVRPRDAVVWALYYPPVLAPLAAREAPQALPPGLQRALERVAANDYAGARAGLDAVPEAARDARYYTYRAGVLLHVGRVEEAAAAIERALALDPAAAEPLAQRAIIHVVQNRRQEALADARRAVELSPESSAARIALSYALQAALQLEEARAVLREAVERDPDDALAWARLAELELMFGALNASEEAAARAVALAPGLARTQMVLGFAALTRIAIDQAKAAFRRAIELDSAEPLARLGLGLARIREGDLEEGRRELEIAAALDPNTSLLRSYLGKAYFEERRDPLDAEQFRIAKALDPNDPTPYFYDAIRKQAVNRPVEALDDLQTSIRLNDNRAVYRSRLLLDQDHAARGARLGRIYNDLGFEQLALVEGWRSLSQDPGNFSAHRLLADTYSSLPRHEIAEDSELLQSQILQPLNVNPVQPRLANNGLAFLNDTGPSDLGFNEFSRLLTANDPFTLDAEGLVGTDDTFADNLVAYGIYDNFSYSAGQFHFETDGLRSNHDLNQDIYNAFVQAELSPTSSVFTEVRRTDQDEGDRDLRFDPDNFSDTMRENSDTKSVRLGIRNDFSPSSTLIASYAYRELDGEVTFPDQNTSGIEEEKVHFGELRYIYKTTLFSVDFGGGYLKGDRNEVFIIEGLPPFEDKPDLTHTNLYAYGRVNPLSSIQLTLGASIDRVDDSTIDQSQVNPKIGLMWNLTESTLLRAAAFRTIKRTVVSSQTLEPTQVSGFNQFFDDFNGTNAWRYGIGLDQKVTDDVFVGAELSHRELEVPQFQATTPPSTIDFHSDETVGRVYGYWTLSDRLAFSAEYRFEQIESDPEASRTGLGKSTTHRFPVEVRWFEPGGFFARARATYVDQEGRFEDVATTALVSGSDRFWVLDGAIGYRFPDQQGHALLEVRNLLDQEFNFQDTDPENASITPDLAVFARLNLRF